MKCFHFLSCFLFVCFSHFALGQNVEFVKSNFKDRPEEFKRAMKAIERGDQYYSEGINGYRKAIFEYEKAYQVNPDNAALNFVLGHCYLNTVFKFKALEFFQKALDLDQEVHQMIYYFLGKSLQFSYRWDEAIAAYSQFLKQLKNAPDPILTRKAVRSMQECNFGKELMKDSVEVHIENLGGNVNSGYPEYGPVISADESVLLFTAKSPGTTGGKRNELTGDFFEDIFVSNNETSGWTEAKPVGQAINTSGNDATIGLSPDGENLLIYRDDNGYGNIYACKRDGANWEQPKKLNAYINSPYHESSATYSYDGKQLFFVSERPEDNRGGSDIYVSRWSEEHKDWGPAENLGPIINTIYDEDGVFMHPDGKTLYFSSSGHNTMGGYDIFFSTWENGAWSEPQNMGHPINTPIDDISFVLSASGRHGYYASYRKDGYGEEDIYRIVFDIQNEIDRQKQMAILKGIVMEASTMEPVEAEITLLEYINEESNLIGTFKSNSKTGKYLIPMPSGKVYEIWIDVEGYKTVKERVDLTTPASYVELQKDVVVKEKSELMTYKADLDIKKVKVGNKIVLKNIYFDYNKYSLRSESKKELGELVQTLQNNPSLRIEIAGHADNIGTNTYNKKLSEQRARSVVDFLVNQGIDEQRLTYKGYGSSKPLTSNETEEGRQMNRRTEFKILSK